MCLQEGEKKKVSLLKSESENEILSFEIRKRAIPWIAAPVLLDSKMLHHLLKKIRVAKTFPAPYIFKQVPSLGFIDFIFVGGGTRGKKDRSVSFSRGE